MAAHRYWRISFNAQNGSATPSAAELQFRDTVGGPHVAGTTTVSSSWNATTNPVSNLFDGDISTWWACNSGASSWLKIDYGGTPKDIVEFMWTARNDSGNTQSPSSWVMEYSDDNVTWGTRDAGDGLTWSVGQSRVFSLPTYGERVSRVAIGVAAQLQAGTVQISRVGLGVAVSQPIGMRISRVAIGVVVDLAGGTVRKPMNFMSSVP